MEQPALRLLIILIIIHAIELEHQLRALWAGGHIGNGCAEDNLRTHTEVGLEISFGNLPAFIGGIYIEEMSILGAIRIFVGTVVELDSRPPQVTISSSLLISRLSFYIRRFIKSIVSMHRRMSKIIPDIDSRTSLIVTDQIAIDKAIASPAPFRRQAVLVIIRACRSQKVLFIIIIIKRDDIDRAIMIV